jgi:integral membrane sensor domain MASE1
MIGWILFLALLAILSYLTDVGVTMFLKNLQVPFLNASLLSVLILLSAAGLLVRMLWMRKRAEKERLRERIQLLESELKGYRDR